MSFPGDDIAPLLVPGPGEGIGFRQGVIVAYDQNTGENQVLVGGTVMENLPILNTSEALLMTPGAVVGLLAVGASAKTMFILGRITIPGTSEALSALDAFRTFSDTINTIETTSSTSFGDLATPGPAVTLSVSASGRVLVILTCRIGWSNREAVGGGMSYVLAGANTVAADFDRSLAHTHIVPAGSITSSIVRRSAVFPMTGLNAGKTTFTAKYAATFAGTAVEFEDRSITVIPL